MILGISDQGEAIIVNSGGDLCQRASLQVLGQYELTHYQLT